MRIKLWSLACALSLMFLTSCVTIVEEIFLNRDGSGRFVLSLDLSSIIVMRDILISETKIGKADSSKLSAEKYDSIVYLNNIADSVKRMFKRPDLIQRAHVRVRLDEPKGIMYMTVEFPFKDIEEINEFRQDINRYTQRQRTVTQNDNAALLGYLPSLTGSKKSIERSTAFTTSDKDDRYAILSKAMLATARVKTIYHLPRKVKSTTIPEAIISGRDCEIELTYRDFISGRKSLDGKIHFK